MHEPQLDSLCFEKISSIKSSGYLARYSMLFEETSSIKIAGILRAICALFKHKEKT
jgi:hypothetical protein